MNVGKIIFYAAFIISAIIIVCSYMRSERPVRTALSGMLSGGAALLAVHFGGGSIGLYIPLNFFTAALSLTLGAPAVIIMTLADKFGII
ncbi:MAG: pro-sigmaK processing inhibitor BofA family protein [Oscillospiraceae bacterium]|nr:pro-sigmaK processing inhibitor BofA family protein [Oscillospiraceae bacterium]